MHFEPFTDVCHLKHAKLAKKTTPTVQREVGEDDHGFQTMFTEQGASASHVAAARSVDSFSRSAGMAREANDAVSAHTHKFEQKTPADS